jgi:hypothetical protein
VAENPPPPEASGSGELFQITFKVKDFGNSVLHLHQTDTAYHDGSPIPHTTLDGIFTNLPNSVTQEIQWEDRTFYVNITSNSTVSSVTFDQPLKTVRFNVTGPDSTEGYALASVPLMLLRAQTGDWQITVDATPSTPLIFSDSDFTFFYMEYGHSTHEMRIIGTETIPEFSWAAILSFLVVFAMAFTIIAWKKALHAGKQWSSSDATFPICAPLLLLSKSPTSEATNSTSEVFHREPSRPLNVILLGLWPRA